MDAGIKGIFAQAAAAEGLHTEAGKRKVKGRKAKTSDHQESVIKIDELKPAIVNTLIADYKHAQDAGETFAEGVKAQAEKAGIQSSVLRKFIVAKAGENFADKKRDALQLSLLFEELSS
jgi:hypothetical protein